MKTELQEGLKDTGRNIMVFLDEYSGREKYYQGTYFDQVLLINKAEYPDLLKEGYNDSYETELDVIIAKFYDGVEMKGVRLFRKGQIVE